MPKPSPTFVAKLEEYRDQLILLCKRKGALKNPGLKLRAQRLRNAILVLEVYQASQDPDNAVLLP